MKTSEAIKGADYDRQVEALHEARRVRNGLLRVKSDRFTVGELLTIMETPHFPTAYSNLSDLIEICDGKPDLTRILMNE